MKKLLKTILILAVLGGTRLFAANPPGPKPVALDKFEYFSLLPKDLQALVLQAINAGSPVETAKRLNELRLVSQDWNRMITSPAFGRQIMESIASQYPTQLWWAVDVATELDTPGTNAWAQDLIKRDPEMRGHAQIRFEMAMGKNDSKRIDRIKRILKTTGMNPSWYLPYAVGVALSPERNAPIDTRMIEAFLDAGADINYISQGRTALDEANANLVSYPTTAPAVIKFLRDRGAKTAAELGK